MRWEELCQYCALFARVGPLVAHGNYLLRLAESQDAVGNPALAVICCNEAIDHYEKADKMLRRITTDAEQWLCACGTDYPVIPLTTTKDSSDD